MPKWPGDIHRIDQYAFMPGTSSILINTGYSAAVVDIFDRTYEEIDGIRLAAFSLSSDGKRALSNFWLPSFDTVSRSSRITDVAKEERSRVSVIDLEGRTLRNIIKSRDAGYSVAQFSADQKSIFFVESEGGEERLIESDLGGENRRIVTSGVLANREFAVHPDGRSLVLTADGKLLRVDIESGALTPIDISLSPPTAEVEPGAVIITGANVFVGNGDSVRSGVTVTIKGGVIQSVSEDIPATQDLKAATWVDADGRFLMAGLVDSHAHVSYQPPFRLADVLKSGITSVIDPATIYPNATERVQAVNRGLIQGPHVYAFSDAIDGTGDSVFSANYSGFVTDPDVGRALVRRFAGLGYDGIKLYSALSPSVSSAMIDEAKRQEILTIGHLGATTWREAVKSGIDGITHAQLYYVGCSPFSGAGNKERMAPPVEECIEGVLNDMSANNVTLDPTIVDGVSALQPGWSPVNALEQRAGESQFHWTSKIVKMAYDYGINIVIGRDDWDWSLVYEMEAYERIGIPNSDILKMATVNAARFLQKDDLFGTLEAGKRADLILIDGDPLERIGDLRNIDMVLQAGEIVVNRLSAELVKPGLESVN